MINRPRLLHASVVVLGLLTCFTDQAWAQCSCTVDYQYRWTHAVPLDLGALSYDDANTVADAANQWGAYMQEASGDLSLGYYMGSGPGSYRFYYDDTLIGTGTWAVTDWSQHTVAINPETLSYGRNFFLHEMLHEMGHVSGFNHTTACTATQTVMHLGTDPNAPYATALTCSDYNSTTNDYSQPVPPGCTDPCQGSPLIIQLGRGGLRLTEPDVEFDLLKLGYAQDVAWTPAGEPEGFLVLDRNGNGAIDDGSELFGDHTPLSWGTVGPTARDGFQALAWFDERLQGGNADGWIDVHDAVYPYIKVWIDFDHNGLSQPAELFPLADAGIIAIGLLDHITARTDRLGDEYRYMSLAYVTNGDGIVSKCPIYDVFLRVVP